MCKFAVLPYCNAAPLVYFISEFCPSAFLVEKYPSEILNELKANKVDAALIPVVDFLQNDSLRMVTGLGICANGPVESVLLQSKKPFGSIKSVRLFRESRTSNMLIRILVSQYFGPNHGVLFTVDDIETDASIIIGDKALLIDKANYIYDLSAMWYRQTNMPFVFAVWAYNSECPISEEIEAILHNSKERGINNIPFLAKIYSERLRLNPAYIEHYLSECLYYEVGQRELESINIFEKFITEINHNEIIVPVRSIPQKKKETNEGIQQLYSKKASAAR